MNKLITLDQKLIGQATLFLTKQGQDQLPTKCKRCQHPLRAMKSRLLGYGPRCLQKLDADVAEAAMERIQTVKVAA